MRPQKTSVIIITCMRTRLYRIFQEGNTIVEDFLPWLNDGVQDEKIGFAWLITTNTFRPLVFDSFLKNVIFKSSLEKE